MDTTAIYAHIENRAKDIIHKYPSEDRANVADVLVETTLHNDICVESIIAQWLMNNLDAEKGVGNKQVFLKIAEHMGPDFAQSLYHTSVWITRVI